MTVTVSNLQQTDRSDWEVLYHGYAGFYRVPMNAEILDTVWGWIHDETNPFFGLIARDEQGAALGLMHCRQMPSPLRGALVGFLDDLFVTPESRGQGVAESLYAALKDLNRSDVKIITVEDPVEYELPGINQVQVHHRIGLDFARILRRQSKDGEALAWYERSLMEHPEFPGVGLARHFAGVTVAAVFIDHVIDGQLRT